MRNEEKGAQNAEAPTGRSGTAMPDCCGPMVERMFQAFGKAAEGAGKGGAAEEAGAERIRQCASMMERLASDRCSRGPRGGSSGT